MLAEHPADYQSQCAGSLAVDYPDLDKTRHESVMQELVEPGQGFVYGEVPEAHFVCRWYVGVVFFLAHDNYYGF